jgi:hypothetical protein
MPLVKGKGLSRKYAVRILPSTPLASVKSATYRMSGKPAKHAELVKRRVEIIQGMLLSEYVFVTLPALLLGLSAADRAQVEQMDLDGPSTAILADSAFAFDTIAPGDEGFNFSHEGGEYDIYETVVDEIAGLHGR